MKIIFFYYYYDDKIKDKKRVEFPPLGMLYLCAALEKSGCDVEVKYFDENTKVDDIPNADIYAFSISSTASYPTYLHLAKKLEGKAKYHIAGNTQATIFPEQVLKQMNLDVVFTGEGEETVTNWIKNGCKEKGIIKGERVDITDLAFPARHLIPDEKIYMNNRVGGKSKNSISMISSRGCVFGCKFCAIQNRGKVKFRDLHDFEKEIQYILKRYPKCDGITLLDETFTLNTKHAVGIASIFKKYGLKWECNSRVDTVNDEIIQALKESNCQEIRLGIESGSQRMVDNMNKGINLDKAKVVIKKLHESGIPVKLYIMHGYPGENIESSLETIQYLNEIREYIHRISLYRFVPLPGSPVFNEGKLNKLDWTDYTIYDNNNHWWGTEADFNNMNIGYRMLERCVKSINNKEYKKELDEEER